MEVVLLAVIGIVFTLAGRWLKPKPQPRRVIWRESDAIARMRIAKEWEPTEHCVGLWDVKLGETERQ
jgi:hypothetical protein